MVIWLIGLSGSGKTVIGKELYSLFKEKEETYVFIDGDVIREMFDNDLGHTRDDRLINSRRISRLCHFLSIQNVNVICSILSISNEDQKWNRKNIKKYKEVFLDVSLEVLIDRDIKDLYKKAIDGKLSNVVGVDIIFPPPVKPDLTINNDGSQSIKEIASHIYKTINKV